MYLKVRYFLSRYTEELCCKQMMLGRLSDIDVSAISFSIQMIFLTEKEA